MNKNDPRDIINNVYDGIIPSHEVFYLMALEDNAQRALIAWERAVYALKNDQNSNSATFSEIHEFMVKCAAISRYFWPIDNNSTTKARGRKLRRSFQMSESSALKLTKDIRNSIEHFDERLDLFQFKSGGQIIVTHLIDDSEVFDLVDGTIFQLLDPKNGILIIMGQSIELRPLILEVERIAEIATSALSNGGRLPMSATSSDE